jgi:hypothetical protein
MSLQLKTVREVVPWWSHRKAELQRLDKTEALACSNHSRSVVLT